MNKKLIAIAAAGLSAVVAGIISVVHSRRDTNKDERESNEAKTIPPVKENPELLQDEEAETFDEFGFRDDGTDRAGLERSFYEEIIEEMYKQLDKAYSQLKDKEFRYALSDVRVVMENATQLIILHYKDHNEFEDKLYDYLRQCEGIPMFENNTEILDQLQSARKTCNITQHELYGESSLSSKKVNTAIMSTRDLLDLMQKKILGKETEDED